MSTALYRLGRWCAAHAWPVVAAWLVVLAVAGTLAGTIGRPLTDQVSIPGTGFEKVLAKLGTEIPSAAGGFGRVVLESDDGPFTDDQKAAIARAMDAWKTVPHVERVVDPFAAQAQIDASAADLAAAKKQLDDGRSQLEAGQKQLADAQGQLAAGEAYLEAADGPEPGRPRHPAAARPGRGRARPGRRRRAHHRGVGAPARGRRGPVPGRPGRRQGLGGHAPRERGRPVRRRPGAVRLQRPVRAAAGPRPDPGEGRRHPRRRRGDTGLQRRDHPGARARRPRRGARASASPSSCSCSSSAALIAAGLPLLVALLGVGVGLGGAVAFTSVVELNSTTPALALMLGLAVGIDYALFIVNRHRANILHGMPLRDSVARSVATAGSAVTFAGTTVVIALAALVLSGIPILAQMGVVAAVTVAVAVLVAVTVSPAVMRLMGTRVVSRRGWRQGRVRGRRGRLSRGRGADDRPEEHGGWYVGAVTRHPWLTAAGVVAVVGVLALPALDMRLGLPDGGSEPSGSSAYAAYTEVADEFGPGMNGPVVAVAELPAGDGTRSDAEVLAAQARIATALRQVDGVVSVVPFGVSDDTDTLAFQVVPSTGPADERTPATVDASARTASLLEAARRRLRRAHRPDRRQHRDLRPPGRRPAHLPARRRRPLAAHPHARLPLGRRAARGDRRVPALGRRRVRSDRGGAPVGLARRAARGAPSPGRCCRSCRSSSSACSSGWRWTTRCSSSPACTSRTPTARTRARPCAPASSTGSGSSRPRRSS